MIVYIVIYYDYERFNCSNFIVGYYSWKYRGCWQQTSPLIVTLGYVFKL